MDENLKERIIAAAYNDCSLIEKIRINRILQKDPEAHRLYLMYSRTAGEIHKIREEKCPDDVLARAEERINVHGYRSSRVLRPAVAFAVLLIAAVMAVFSLTSRSVHQYSDAEVTAAGTQARESLEIVSRILNRTTSTLGEEILPEKVSKPVQKGIDIINNLLIGG